MQNFGNDLVIAKFKYLTPDLALVLTMLCLSTSTGQSCPIVRKLLDIIALGKYEVHYTKSLTKSRAVAQVLPSRF